jgi:cell division protein FtsI/penicillin-binding protein 2
MENTYGDEAGDHTKSLAGLRFTPSLQRSYPEKSLASNILGFVNWEGEGFFGIEERFDDQMAGQTKYVWVSRDPNKVEEQPKIPSGASLVLTIDRAMQSEVEKIVDKAIAETGSESATIMSWIHAPEIFWPWPLHHGWI